MRALILVAAQDGGFAVWSESGRVDFTRPMLFAGSLAECLEYMRVRLSEPDPTPVVRKAA